MEKLENSTQEGRDYRLNKALKLRKLGKTLIKVGGFIVLAGIVVTISFVLLDHMEILQDLDMLSGAILGWFCIAGVGTMVVGIYFLVIGSKKVKRIKEKQ